MIGNAYHLVLITSKPWVSDLVASTQEIPGNDAAGPVPSPRVSFTDAGQISGSTRIYHPQKKNIPEHIYLGSYFHHKRYKRFWKRTVFHIFAFFLKDGFFFSFLRDMMDFLLNQSDMGARTAASTAIACSEDVKTQFLELISLISLLPFERFRYFWESLAHERLWKSAPITSSNSISVNPWRYLQRSSTNQSFCISLLLVSGPRTITPRRTRRKPRGAGRRDSRRARWVHRAVEANWSPSATSWVAASWQRWILFFEMDLERHEVSKSPPKEVHVRNEDREERGSRWTVGKSCRQAV